MSIDDSITADARNKILVAADRLYQRLGPTKTTVADISRAAGVSRPTVYRHFGDRDGLLRAIWRRQVELLAEHVRLSMADYQDFDEQLIEGLLHPAIFTTDGVGVTDSNAQAGDLVNGLAAMTWTPLVQGAVDRGEARADLNVEQSARWLAWMQLMLSGMQPDGASVRQMLTAYVLPAFAPSAAGPGRQKTHVAARA